MKIFFYQRCIFRQENNNYIFVVIWVTLRQGHVSVTAAALAEVCALRVHLLTSCAGGRHNMPRPCDLDL